MAFDWCWCLLMAVGTWKIHVPIPMSQGGVMCGQFLEFIGHPQKHQQLPVVQQRTSRLIAAHSQATIFSRICWRLHLFIYLPICWSIGLPRHLQACMWLSIVGLCAHGARKHLTDMTLALSHVWAKCEHWCMTCRSTWRWWTFWTVPPGFSKWLALVLLLHWATCRLVCLFSIVRKLGHKNWWGFTMFHVWALDILLGCVEGVCMEDARVKSW